MLGRTAGRGTIMRLTWRDGVATMCVALAALVYVAWLADEEVLGMSGARPLGVTVLLLGLAASVTAVVFGVGLFRASKLYLAIASLFGLAALTAGIAVLANESKTMLGVLVGSTVVLWIMSTVRHAMAGGRRGDHVMAHPPESALGSTSRLRHG
jgi:hypothetical protein